MARHFFGFAFPAFVLIRGAKGKNRLRAEGQAWEADIDQNNYYKA